MKAAMKSAGFVGIDQAGDVLYARTNPSLPEFTATPQAGQWRLAIQWPLRASALQCAHWNTHHSDAPLDVDLGETRMQFLCGPEGLARWAALVDEMVMTCTIWRRATRQLDEGM